VRVHLAAEHALELKVAHLRFQTLGIALDVARRALVALALGQIQQLGRILDPLDRPLDLRDLGGQARALAPQGLRALGRRPDGRLL
jgi:hypothetical protein